MLCNSPEAVSLKHEYELLSSRIIPHPYVRTGKCTSGAAAEDTRKHDTLILISAAFVHYSLFLI